MTVAAALQQYSCRIAACVVSCFFLDTNHSFLVCKLKLYKVLSSSDQDEKYWFQNDHLLLFANSYMDIYLHMHVIDWLKFVNSEIKARQHYRTNGSALERLQAELDQVSCNN